MRWKPIILLLIAGLPWQVAWAQGSRVYTVEKLSIEASASDAVAAKKRAIAEAERRAEERLESQFR